MFIQYFIFVILLIIELNILININNIKTKIIYLKILETNLLHSQSFFH